MRGACFLIVQWLLAAHYISAIREVFFSFFFFLEIELIAGLADNDGDIGTRIITWVMVYTAIR